MGNGFLLAVSFGGHYYIFIAPIASFDSFIKILSKKNLMYNLIFVEVEISIAVSNKIAVLA